MKKYLAIVLFVCIFFSSCHYSPASNDAHDMTNIYDTAIYDIAVIDTTDGSLFKDTVQTIQTRYETYVEEGISSSKEEKINGENISIYYFGSVKLGDETTHIYKNNSKEIECQYNSLNKLTQINFKDTQADLATDQKGYLDFITKILAQYDITTFSDYRYSCQTKVVVSNENATWQEKHDEFYVPQKANERLTSYTFTFQKYYEDIPTTDRISVHFGIIANSITIKFDEEQFLNLKDISIDEESMDKVLTQYISNSIDTSKYDFRKYEVTSRELRYIADRLYYIYTVEITLCPQGGTSEDDFVYLALIAFYMNNLQE